MPVTPGAGVQVPRASSTGSRRRGCTRSPVAVPTRAAPPPPRVRGAAVAPTTFRRRTMTSAAVLEDRGTLTCWPGGPAELRTHWRGDRDPRVGGRGRRSLACLADEPKWPVSWSSTTPRRITRWRSCAALELPNVEILEQANVGFGAGNDAGEAASPPGNRTRPVPESGLRDRGSAISSGSPPISTPPGVRTGRTAACGQRDRPMTSAGALPTLLSELQQHFPRQLAAASFRGASSTRTPPARGRRLRRRGLHAGARAALRRRGRLRSSVLPLLRGDGSRPPLTDAGWTVALCADAWATHGRATLPRRKCRDSATTTSTAANGSIWNGGSALPPPAVRAPGDAASAHTRRRSARSTTMTSACSPRPLVERRCRE